MRDALFVSEKEKWNAMAACDWLILPSEYESLSISLLKLGERPAPRSSTANPKSSQDTVDVRTAAFAITLGTNAKQPFALLTRRRKRGLGHRGRITSEFVTAGSKSKAITSARSILAK